MDNHTLDRQKPRREKGFWVAYLLLLPSFALFSLFSYYPFLKTIINSFSVRINSPVLVVTEKVLLIDFRNG